MRRRQLAQVAIAVTHTGTEATTYSNSANSDGTAFIPIDGTELEWLEGFLKLVLTGSPVTPSIAVTLQNSPDGGTTWRDVMAFDAMTSTGTQTASEECNRMHGTEARRFLSALPGSWRLKFVASTDSGAATWTGTLYLFGA